MLRFAFALPISLLSLLVACNSSVSGGPADSGTAPADAGGNDGSVVLVDAQTNGLTVEPAALQTISVVAGQALPTIDYAATFNGTSVSVGWGVDRGEAGTVEPGPSASAVFTPSALAGGLVTIFANYNDEIIERQVLVELEVDQNGPSTSPEEQDQIAEDLPTLTEGGGVGGVGGEGLGIPVVDQAILDALATPSETGQSEGFSFLYPYDATIWPRGLPAPLLQWDWSLGDADAIKIEMETTSGSFSYRGTFARPAILTQSGTNFVRHPIPQDAWNMATNTAGELGVNGLSDDLVIRLTVARNGVAYGPIVQTHKIAPARLAGTIYYQSYGTNLAKNFDGAVGGDNRFGGAVLSIKVGDVAPQLAAGSSGPATNCRVCHSVSANGSRLVAQTSAAPSTTYGYSITPSLITEAPLSLNSDFPGLTPDGSFGLSKDGTLFDLNAGGATVATTGLENITNLGTPSFSPGGDKLVFNPMSGSAVANPTQSLVVMDYDSSTQAFTSPVEVLNTSGQPATTRPGWAAFFPAGQSIIYQQQTVAGGDGNGAGDLRTRRGSKSHLAWTLADNTGTPTPLAQANGTGYLPSLSTPPALVCTADGQQVGGMDADHSDDENLNYEPTINPIPSGGYAWVVFTSRRMYGNVATIPPFCSDPRGVDLIDNITTKKLWVAAVDLNAPSGTDPSHPAFYLPAQELLAGNARGFWTLDPCRADGSSCETGDQCCNGFCSQTGGPDDPLECGDAPTGDCSMTQEFCTMDSDCCDPNDSCINEFCSQIIVD